MVHCFCRLRCGCACFSLSRRSDQIQTDEYRMFLVFLVGTGTENLLGKSTLSPVKTALIWDGAGQQPARGRHGVGTSAGRRCILALMRRPSNWNSQATMSPFYAIVSA